MPPRNHKAQLSLFLIVAVLVVVFSVMMVRPGIKEPPFASVVPSSDGSMVRVMVQACVDNAARVGVREFGLTGGLPIPALFQPSAVVNGRFVALHRIGSNVLDFSSEQFGGYLAQWIAVKVGDCIQDLSVPVLSIPFLPKVKASLLEKGVNVEVHAPIRIPVSDGEFLVSPNYQSWVPVSLLPFLEEVKYWTKYDVRPNGAINALGLARFQEKGWIPTVAPWEKVVVVLLEDPSQRIGNSNFAFQFAIAGEAVQ